MKLWKKILIAIIILSAIGVGLIGFGIFEAHEAYKNKIEPDMKRYVTMTQQEQDEYVLSKLELLYSLSNKKDNSSEYQAAINALKTDPAVRKAGLVWGRSLCAVIITNSDDIKATLSPQDKEKYATEALDFDAKSKYFQTEIERVMPKKK